MLVHLKGTNLFYKNSDICLGEVLMKEDGFYDFYPNHIHGTYWPSHLLRSIADFLDDKNAPWQANIEKYFADSS